MIISQKAARRCEVIEWDEIMVVVLGLYLNTGKNVQEAISLWKLILALSCL
jgi:hypothetical protein